MMMMMNLINCFVLLLMCCKFLRCLLLFRFVVFLIFNIIVAHVLVLVVTIQ